MPCSGSLVSCRAPGRSLRPDRERKREDDFRLSCYVRTVDRVTFPEARDSSNFPKLEFITFCGRKERIFPVRPQKVILGRSEFKVANSLRPKPWKGRALFAPNTATCGVAAMLNVCTIRLRSATPCCRHYASKIIPARKEKTKE